jgi:DNA-binding NarL/FixJ family response regulator
MRFSILKKRNPTALIVICTDVPNEQEGVKVLQFGANGYTNTYITDSLFSEVIATVEAGNIWVGPELLQSLLKHLLVDASDKEQKHAPRSPDDIFEGLSSREKEVVSVLVTGVSNKTIARELDITERTVKAHLSSIFQKTGIADRISLILRAKEQSRL